MTETEFENTFTMPLLALRGLTVFPGMLLTFDVERSASIGALEQAGDKQLVFLTAQRNISADLPKAEELYQVGTVCRIRQLLRQPRSSLCRVMVEGMERAEALEIDTNPRGYSAVLRMLPDKPERMNPDRMEALQRKCISLFEEYLRMNPEMAAEQILNILANPDPTYVAWYIAQNLHVDADKKQVILESVYSGQRLGLLARLLQQELSVLSFEQELNEQTQDAVNRDQRDYFLRQQMKVIQSELGEDGGGGDDLAEYRFKIETLDAPKEVRERLRKELSRLAKQPFGSSEAALLRSYLDVCLELPWNTSSRETVDIAKARRILDAEHFGLDKVKERILEYLAVKQLSPEIKGGLLCLVGPPGTGKTSIAMSVAKATNRKLVRVSLGGVHDEAEIRGHRKTYIGAMPGRIISGINQAGTCNPLMVLDEIDKLGADYRGDPGAALLEALDPEQNKTFRDNFLELPFDLSGVFFITTANSLSTIPRPLLDRMEIIELTSYTDEEKLQIAKRHLLPKQRKKHGLKGTQLKVGDAAIRALIRGYTRESGVRQLEREMAALCRKAASGVAEERFKCLTVQPESLEDLLGPAKFKPDSLRLRDEVGLVRGLAYTSVGGEVLDVEVAVVDGKGSLELTGNLGDVMKESAKAAMTYIRSRADKLGLEPEFYKKKDIHIHFPEGAVPKDGPSAGITMTIALISALTGRPVRHDVAMTGEITLRGRVLPIGGLREKTMAALRAGVKLVILPAENEADLAEIDQTVRAALEFLPVEHADQVVEAALLPLPEEHSTQNRSVPQAAERPAVRQ